MVVISVRLLQLDQHLISVFSNDAGAAVRTGWYWCHAAASTRCLPVAVNRKLFPMRENYKEPCSRDWRRRA